MYDMKKGHSLKGIMKRVNQSIIIWKTLHCFQGKAERYSDKRMGMNLISS